MTAFAVVLAIIAAGAILLWTLDRANARLKTKTCPACMSRIDKRATVCAACGKEMPVDRVWRP